MPAQTLSQSRPQLYLQTRTTMEPIPKPTGRWTSLQKAMRLQDNTPRFSQAMKHLRALTKDMLDGSLRMRDQDPELVAALERKAIETYPFFCGYQDAWPVRTYISKHLSSKIYQGRQHRKKAEQAHAVARTRCGRPEEQPKQAVHCMQKANVPLRRSSRIRSRLDSSPARTRRTEAAPASERLVSPVPVQILEEHPPAPDSAGPGGHPTSKQHATSVTSTTHAFSNFLRNLGPHFIPLEPTFILGGVTSEASFRALSQFSHSEREILLRITMGLNAFQYYAVLSALKSVN